MKGKDRNATSDPGGQEKRPGKAFSLNKPENPAKKTERLNGTGPGEKYKVIFDHAPVGIFRATPDGRMLEANNAMAQLFGYDSPENFIKSITNIAFELYDDPGERSRLLDLLARHEGPAKFEGLFKKKDGTSFNAIIRLIATEDTTSKIKYWDGFIDDLTEEKKIIRELAENEARLQLALEGANMGLWDWDLVTGKVLVSEHYSRMLGFGSGDLIFSLEEFFKLIVPEDQHTIRQIQEISTGNRAFSEGIEYRVYSKSGEPLWLFSKGLVAQRDKSGEPVRIIGITIDITERKHFEKAIQESAYLYRTTIDSMTNYNIHVVNRDYTIEIFNETFQKLNISLGISPDAVGKCLFEVFPFLPRKVKKEYEEVFQEGKTIITEEKTRFGDRMVYTESHKIPVFEDGRVSKVITVIMDITEKLTRKKALELELQINLVLNELARELLLPSLSINHIARLVLEAALRLTNSEYGLVSSRDKQTGTLFTHVITDFADGTILDSDAIPVKQKSGEGYNTLLGYSLNRRVPFFSNDPVSHPAFTHFMDPNSRIRSFLSAPAIAKNELFGEIALANSLEGYNAKALVIVQQLADFYCLALTRLDAQTELENARNKALEADRMKSSFLANMSHEIRTPMNAILGFLELLKKPETEDDQKDSYLKIIDSSGKLLLNIIDDIIDLAKIEAGQMKIDRISFDLQELCMELLTAFNTDKDKKGKVDLEIIFTPHRALHKLLIYSDPYRLRQILSNLIGNAIKYTHQGSIEFGYTLSTLHTLRFYVKDTGVGISEEDKRFVFDRFKQADETYSRQQGGTGLGLTISKALVELMGGKIWVDSEPGQGSAFYFEIPYFPAVHLVADIKDTESSDNPYNWSDRQILITEDDDISFKLLEILLSRTRVNIVRAVTGLEAVEICRSMHNIDVILMDLQLPVMDGYEAIRQIRTFRRNVPVIVQSAHAMAEEIQKAFLAGCDDFLSKPINDQELFGKMKKYLN